MQPQKTFEHALSLNYELGAYKIEGYLGEGGFGITYLARHQRLQDLVAIKEYFPSELCIRQADSTVISKRESDKGTYAWGLERFLDEAKTLILFRHPHIISVRDYFEMNGTAYIVMEYEIGQTFKKWLKESFDSTLQRPSEQALLNIIIPILDALTLMHEEKFLHRDIKPDNIYIRSNGSSVLIDFGATRQALGDKSQSLSTILSPGYAPKEQYSSRGNFGPWTDLYAVGATLYYAITGHKPPSSTDRGDARDEGKEDPLEALQTLYEGDYSDHFLHAIDTALAYLPKDRPQTAREFQQALLGRDNDATIVKTTFVAQSQPKSSPKQRSKTPLNLKKIWFNLVGFVASVGIVGIIGMMFYQNLQRLELNKAPSIPSATQLASPSMETSPVSVKTTSSKVTIEQAQADLESDNKVRQQAAIKALTELANAGDANAMRLLGFGYYLGIGVKKNYKTGCQWYKQAANAGNVKAREMYEKSKYCR